MSDVITAQNEKSDLKEWWAPDGQSVDTEILERRRKVAIHWNQLGYGVAKSARELKVSVTTVYNDRKALLKAWQMSVQADIVEIVAREVYKLEMQEAELWDAWERSKKPEIMKTTEWYTDKKGVKRITLQRETETNRVPDVKIMDALTRIQERRARLLGLDKAITVESAAFSFSIFVQEAYEANMQSKAKKPEVLDVTPTKALNS